MSFKESTTIDITATNYRMLSNTNIYNNILKGLLFVGANASGKTNAITSIRFLLKMLFSNERIDGMSHFCFFPSSDYMTLEFSFKFDEDVIVYKFVIDRQMHIIEEDLSLNDQKMLSRVKDYVKSNITEKKIYDDSSIDSSTLFLRNIYFNTKFKGYAPLEKWFEFLINSVYVNSVENVIEVLGSNIKHKLQLNSYLENIGTEKINHFFNHFGFNQEVIYDSKHKVYNNLELEKVNSKEIFMKRNDMDLWIPFQCESLGNKTLLSILPAIMHTVENNSMLLIDEFSSALHNELEALIVRYFMSYSKQSQMFIVSHSTNLLTNSLLRPDQIYSTNFIDKNGTFLKRFSSESPRESQNLEKMYLSGIFEGLPKYKNAWNEYKQK